MRDVIVVGAGPAGSAVAKRCVEYGLNTLILEKRRLPREKVCGGMIMGPVAHTLVKQEFGDIPETVLSRPPSLSGYILHVPGVGSSRLDNFTSLAWRTNLDYWMNQKAQAKGAEIWDGARVTGLKQKGQGLAVEIEKKTKRQELDTRFVVGADGLDSVVRRLLFSELKLSYRQIYQVGYRGELDLDTDHYHWFFPVEPSSMFFTTHQKDGLVIINVNSELGQVKRYMDWARDYLAESYNFDINQKLVWQAGCIGAQLHKELITSRFLPAKGNVLLVGDAASFILPSNGEGIGTAIQSGLLAADSIKKAIESGRQADKIYLTEVGRIISVIRELYPWRDRISNEIKSGGNSLPEVLRGAFKESLRMF